MTTPLQTNGEWTPPVKPAVAAMAGYAAPPSSAPIKLNQNESAYPLPDELRQKICRRALAMDWRRYPASDPIELREALAHLHGLDKDCFVFGNGSDEVMLALWLACVEENSTVLSVAPTFSMYATLCASVGARYHSVPLGKDFAFDGVALREAVATQQPRLTILAAPNNPTGTMPAWEDLVALIESAEGIVAIDEAYIEFTANPRGVLPLLATCPNLIIFRTFSKAVSAAGLRLGYCIADPALAREINKVRQPYNMGVFSRAAALTLIEERESFLGQIQLTRGNRDDLYQSMLQISGIRPIPSEANFILFECLAREAADVFNALLLRGILVRNVTSYPQLSRALRVSVGTEAENREFLNSLTAVMKGAE